MAGVQKRCDEGLEEAMQRDSKDGKGSAHKATTLADVKKL